MLFVNDLCKLAGNSRTVGGVFITEFGSSAYPKVSCGVVPNVKAQEIPSNTRKICLHSIACAACIQKTRPRGSGIPGRAGSLP